MMPTNGAAVLHFQGNHTYWEMPWFDAGHEPIISILIATHNEVTYTRHRAQGYHWGADVYNERYHRAKNKLHAVQFLVYGAERTSRYFTSKYPYPQERVS